MLLRCFLVKDVIWKPSHSVRMLLVSYRFVQFVYFCLTLHVHGIGKVDLSNIVSNLIRTQLF